MALTGWHWTIFGAIIAAVSGYVYFNVGHNNSMALFFFIGVVFLIIGLVKLFFRKVDDTQVFNNVERSEREKSSHSLPAVQMTIAEEKPANKVEALVSIMAKDEEKKPVHHETHQVKHETHAVHGYTNSYAKNHQYKGPVKTASNTSANATHPISSHVQPKVVNSSNHSIKCKKCSTTNSEHSTYCHNCGNRLK